MENVGSAGSDAVSQREITSQGLTHDGSMVLVYMLTEMGDIDGIHGTPYIAAPWILWVYIYNCIFASMLVYWRVSKLEVPTINIRFM
jgi:hypothetical protein